LSAVSISIGGKLLTKQEAILIALFSPHVQTPGIQTAIDAYISELKMNNPYELVKIFKTLLTTGNLCLQSGYTCPQPQVCDGEIVVNMENCGKNRNCIFGDKQGAKWLKDAGIINGCDYTVRFRVYDMGDIFFAGVFWVIFGHSAKNIGFDNGCLLYTNGIPCFFELLESHDTATYGVRSTLRFIKESAEKLCRNSLATYMRIIIIRASGGGNARTAETVNIFVGNILNFDQASIEDGGICGIGIFNRVGVGGAVMLAIKRIGSEFKFVTIEDKIIDNEVTMVAVLPHGSAVAFNGTTPIAHQWALPQRSIVISVDKSILKGTDRWEEVGIEDIEEFPSEVSPEFPDVKVKE
jgi:hypothetical protein